MGEPRPRAFVRLSDVPSVIPTDDLGRASWQLTLARGLFHQAALIGLEGHRDEALVHLHEAERAFVKVPELLFYHDTTNDQQLRNLVTQASFHRGDVVREIEVRVSPGDELGQTSSDFAGTFAKPFGEYRNPEELHVD